jgi:hypothetical protein
MPCWYLKYVNFYISAVSAHGDNSRVAAGPRQNLQGVNVSGAAWNPLDRSAHSWISFLRIDSDERRTKH